MTDQFEGCYTEKTSIPFPFKLNGILSCWQFSFRFWTKYNSIWFNIERKTVCAVISHLIRKEMEIQFSQCTCPRYRLISIRGPLVPCMAGQASHIERHLPRVIALLISPRNIIRTLPPLPKTPTIGGEIKTDMFKIVYDCTFYLHLFASQKHQPWWWNKNWHVQNSIW